MDLSIILIIILVIVIIALIFERIIGTSKQKAVIESINQQIEDRYKALLPEMLKLSQDQLISIAEQKLGSEKKEIRIDLENKRSEIERMIKVLQEELKDSRGNLEKAEKDRVGSFMALKSELEEYKKITEELKHSTTGLKNVLSNNQMRGQFGEQVADDLLKNSGFVKGVQYDVNKEQGNVDTRPDFTVYLPDKTKINIDVKFPYRNLQKATETENQEEKKKYIQDFAKDVREKIKQVTTRDYINPEEKTVDFVILFIPNEMIFSYIYDQLNEIITEAMNKKVVLAGPFSFTAILRLVMQSYENFRYQTNIREIVGHIQGFIKEFEKYNDAVNTLGDRIASVSKQYGEVSSTRTNVLMKTVDKIKYIDEAKKGSETPQIPLIAE